MRILILLVYICLNTATAQVVPNLNIIKKSVYYKNLYSGESKLKGVLLNITVEQDIDVHNGYKPIGASVYLQFKTGMCRIMFTDSLKAKAFMDIIRAKEVTKLYCRTNNINTNNSVGYGWEVFSAVPK